MAKSVSLQLLLTNKVIFTLPNILTGSLSVEEVKMSKSLLDSTTCDWS